MKILRNRYRNNPLVSMSEGHGSIAAIKKPIPILGQWYESTISYDIAWLEYENPPKQTTNNLNENTIPPKEIHDGDVFKAVLCSNHLAPFVLSMTTEEKVIDLLQKYTDESPWLTAVLKD